MFRNGEISVTTLKYVKLRLAVVNYGQLRSSYATFKYVLYIIFDNTLKGNEIIFNLWRKTLNPFTAIGDYSRHRK